MINIAKVEVQSFGNSIFNAALRIFQFTRQRDQGSSLYSPILGSPLTH